MKDLIVDQDNNVLVSSKDIADNFKKDHTKVMRDIKKLECSDEFRQANYGYSTFTSLQNKVLPCVNMSKDGFTFLCMGFTGKKAAEFKERYINAFNKLESAISRSVKRSPKSMEELNEVSKRIENLNNVGSFHGKGLANFARDKRKEVELFEIALDEAQLSLNIF